MIMQVKGRLKTKELENHVLRLIVNEGLQKGDSILSENKLAEMFNVSRVTVRQALAELVRKNILYKIKGKGTFVNNIHSLKSKSTQTNMTKSIALLCCSISNSYFANVARGAEDNARAHGFHMTFCSTDGDTKKEELYINELLAKGIDKILLSPTESFPFTNFIKKLCSKHKNIIIINDKADGLDINSVSSDDAEGAYLATKYLLKLGHKKIAHICGASTTSNAHERDTGYRKALLESGIIPNEDLIYRNKTFNKEQGAQAMEFFLALPKTERPSAVFAASDMMAWGAYEVIMASGLRVPEDISLIGFGDLLETARMGIELTSVNQNGYGVGFAASEILLGKSFPNVLRKKILLPTKLVIRKSCTQLISQTVKSKD